MSDQKPLRHIPVRPNLRQLKKKAKDFLKSIRPANPVAIEEFQQSHPAPQTILLDQVQLSDAQFALARSYGVASWPRIVQACDLTDAIWRDDVSAVRDLVTKNPSLLHEQARGTKNGNWGPPLSYAANLGR